MGPRSALALCDRALRQSAADIVDAPFYEMQGAAGPSSDAKTGVIYAPGATLDLVGGGAPGSVQIIADSFDINGTGDLFIDFVEYVEIPAGKLFGLVE